MGFFGKIKSAVTQLTGKAATVQLQVNRLEVKRGDSLDFTVVVNATGQLEAKGMFIEIVGTETLRYEYRTNSTSTNMPDTEHGFKTNETYRRRDALMAGPLTMAPGETKEFKGVLLVPPNVQPTYTGVEARHEWKVRALADVSMGADPDMEIIIFVV